MRRTAALLLILLVPSGGIPCRAETPPHGGDPSPPYRLDGNTEFGISYVDLATPRQRELAASHLAALGVTTIRFDASWALHEPEEGSYEWAGMDRRFEFLDQNGIRPFITFPADAPEWVRDRIEADKRNERSTALPAADIERFRRYVEAFLRRYEERYPGLVRYVQFGNEWASPYWYAGSAQEFAATQTAFYRAVRTVVPEATVVLGGFSVGQLAVLAALDQSIETFWTTNGEVLTVGEIRRRSEDEEIREILHRIETVLRDAPYDWVDVHLYDQPENFAAYVGAIRSRLPGTFTGEIVTTEFGGPHPVLQAQLGDEEAADLMAEYLRTIDALDLPLALHFRLVRSSHTSANLSGMLRRGLLGLRELPTYPVFLRINNPDGATR